MTKRESDRIKELLGAGLKDNVEIRTRQIELRVNRKEDGALPKIEGYAAVFNKDSEDMGFIERVAPGAFKGALKISDARALFNHDANYVLGRQSSGTLELREDKKGLFMSVNPPDTQIIRDLVLTPIERGDINQQSFGFTIAADKWDGLDSDHPTRTITEVREIFDVSPVTFPAYTDTTVALRSLALAKEATKKETVFTVVVDADIDNEEPIEFEFRTQEEASEFLNKIKDLRSSPKPMLPDDDIAPVEPMLEKTEEPTEDALLAKIRKITERYSE